LRLTGRGTRPDVFSLPLLGLALVAINRQRSSNGPPGTSLEPVGQLGHRNQDAPASSDVAKLVEDVALEVVAAAAQHLRCGLRADREERMGLPLSRTNFSHGTIVQYAADMVCSEPNLRPGRAMSTEERHPTSAIVARRLKEIREDRRPHMTKADLARRLLEVMGEPTDDPKRVEMVRVMVSRTESGVRAVTVDELVLFAQALEVPPGVLLEGSGGIDVSALEEQMLNMLEQLRAAKKLESEPPKKNRIDPLEAALEPKRKERKP
jgi:hypothetical protein